MDKLISRNKAINKFCELLDTTEENPVTCIRQVLDDPSVQVGLCDDAVSRDDVIRLLHSGYHSKSMVEEVKELPSAQPKTLTDAEVVICKLYLEDLDKYKTCNEYKLLMGLLDGTACVQPEIIWCRDCKHWRDSDGKYRRGIGAESKCPLNLQAVYDGEFYCGFAERRTDD